jgi:ketosteroid isomerase-like protein
VSQENVELVRRLYAGGGPFALPLSPEDETVLLDRMFGEYYEERFEVMMPPDYPEGEQIFVGRAGMARLIATLRDSWTEFRFEPEQFIGCGPHAVLVLIHVVAEGGASGLTTDRRTAHLWGVRGERLSSIQIYRDRAEALEVVGVSDSGT